MNRLRITDPIYIGAAKQTRMTAGRVDAGTIPGKSRKRTATIEVPRKKRTRRR